MELVSYDDAVDFDKIAHQEYVFDETLSSRFHLSQHTFLSSPQCYSNLLTGAPTR